MKGSDQKTSKFCKKNFIFFVVNAGAYCAGEPPHAAPKKVIENQKQGKSVKGRETIFQFLVNSVEKL